MMRLKACPRCGGDLELEESPGYKGWHCLQCGRTTESEGIDWAPSGPAHPNHTGRTLKRHPGAP